MSKKSKDDHKYFKFDHCIEIYKNRINPHLEDRVKQLSNIAINDALNKEKSNSQYEFDRWCDKISAKIRYNETKNLISQIDININELKAIQKELKKEATRLNSKYKIKKKPQEWPTKKLDDEYKKNEKFRKFIDSHKYFYSIRNDLFFNHYIKYRDREKYNKRFGFHNKKRPYVFIKPGIDKICKKFDIKEIDTVRNYIKFYCDLGILKEMGKMSSREQKIYAIGYWNISKGEVKGKPSLLRAEDFIKNFENIIVNCQNLIRF